MVHLLPITANNFWEVIELKVTSDQTDLVTSNAVSIAQAKVQPECVPLAVYDDATLVGFVMYCLDSDDGEYWLYRLMIDATHQGKGYGSVALSLVIDIIQQDSSRHKLFLGVDLRGDRSVQLYRSAGFHFTGQVFGKEHIMVLEW